jgi:hypothetical protein
MHARVTTAISAMVIYLAIATGSWAGSAVKPGAFTGRFVGRVEGPPITGFGANRRYYIFEIDSSSEPQFAIISYTFFIYEPVLPRTVLDYSRIFTINAVLDGRCGQTLEQVSKRWLFNANGAFDKTKYELVYSTNLPPLTLPWKQPLPCYALSPQSAASIQ